MKPICVPCQRFYRPEKNGEYFIEGYPVGPDRAEPGLAEPEKWQPYKLWCGDRWKCPDCGSVIIVGCGLEPVSIHHLPDFKTVAERARIAMGGTILQVNDC